MTHTESWIQALGWALVHSLWQGAAVALLAALLLPRLRSATIRYWTAFGGLLVVLCSVLGTFWWLWEPSEAAQGAAQLIINGTPYQIVTDHSVPSATTQTWLDIGIEWLEARHTWIVGLWVTGAVLLLVRLLGGLWYLRKMESLAMTLHATEYEAAFQRFTHALRLSRRVRLLESAHIHAPATFGWLRPVVLLPVGLVNQLSTAEVEAILVHELAHLARRDWLAQMVQATIEALLYYHPVVWWLSGIVRDERERCCDALALRYLGDQRVTYARALVQVQAFVQARTSAAKSPALALYATGSHQKKQRAPFFERIQWILLQPPQQKSMFMERTIAAALLVAALTCWGVRAAAPLLPASITASAESWWGAEASQSVTDTLPPGSKKRVIINRSVSSVFKINDEVDGKKVQLTSVGGAITELNVDGQTIAPADFPKYKSITDPIMAQLPAPPPPPPPAPTVIKSSIHMQYVIKEEIDGKDVEITFKGGKMTDVVVDGQRIDPADYGKYDQIISRATALNPPPPPPPPPPATGTGMMLLRSNGGPGAQVFTLTDGSTNKTIEVRDGKVFVDGHEVKEGEPYVLSDLPSMTWADEVGQVMVINSEIMEHMPDMPEMPVMLEGLDPANRIQMDMDTRAMVLDARLAELDARRVEIIAEQQAEMDEIQRNMDVQVYRTAAGGGNFQDVMVRSLQGDYLITDPNNYTIELTGKKLKVNGKKQPENMHRKYLNLYKRHHGKPLGANDVLKFEVKG
jgi:beta-lactamase regulating signal transducer with metallopeptidase domain